MLGSVSGELGLRKFIESQGYELIVTTDKDGPNSVFERELPDAEVVISQPFWPAYLTAERIAKAPKLKLAITLSTERRVGRARCGASLPAPVRKRHPEIPLAPAAQHDVPPRAVSVEARPRMHGEARWWPRQQHRRWPTWDRERALSERRGRHPDE